ncbi:sigma-70 family RNA polymerase sigma factor [uncultured Clostridium sp.]|uniref:sigma-70 family RNA polymerase sigma factor n=1 Tax=uncultured Clostridium sp. TaxID=59620 RepID=UPI0025EF485F|nr:sigma-70 family RNA polymerase sigma factor [uncultured Clostridium sp.]MDU4883977.1 sigma-70 family RNA polymerase sigma factor [Clostridium celatum]MDU7077220.1 sigma-70 family RNA polymerase sigma factor [Clostridium celatum]
MFRRRKEDNIIRAKKGNKEGFINLIEENLISMYRVAKGILLSQEDIDDAIQNTILLSYKNINTLKKNEFFKTWLIRILINECNKIYNFNKKYIDFNEIKENYTNDEYENFDLKRAIQGLSEDLRLPIVLFYFEDMQISEIADLMNIPIGTVKSRLSRAKIKIAQFVKEEEVM